jgi:site-specific recombinase XerD
MNSNRFPILIERYFCDHLRTQRNASAHTISAYRDTFRLLLGFLAVRHRTTIDRLTFREFSADDVLAFLDHLERKRGNTVRSRNVRLAAIRGFTHFAVAQASPDFVTGGQRILAIPCKRTTKPVLGFMSRDEVTAVLGAIDRATPRGFRDHLLFSLLYQTGARISEALQLRAADTQGGFLRLHGKGRKERSVPIPSVLTKELRQFVQVHNLKPDQPLFANRQGAQLTREGAALRLTLALKKAVQFQPSLQGRKITPHTWRHTTAMHLLQAGVPLEVIALWLGHQQPIVTHTYVQADLKMKRECMTLLEKPIGRRPPRDPARFSRLLSFLESQ